MPECPEAYRGAAPFLSHQQGSSGIRGLKESLAMRDGGRRKAAFMGCGVWGDVSLEEWIRFICHKKPLVFSVLIYV